MATSAFKSTSKRASIGGSTSGDSAPRSLRRSRSLSRFSRSIAPETEMDYLRDAPKGKFVNTMRGSGAPFPEISLDDLALEFFSSSSKNESDGGAVDRSEREGRSLSRRGEIGRWASDTASSRRRGRSVSGGRGDAVSSSSAASGVQNVVTDTGARRRRSVSVARSRVNAVSSGDKVAVSSNTGTRRRRSLSVARYHISDSESDLERSQNSSSRATVKAPVGRNAQLPLASKATASSYLRLGSRSHIDLSLIHDGYSSQSSALTDDESKDTHFGKNGTEKIIRAVHAQKKGEHPSEAVANGGLYEAMRKELRHAVEEIRTELNQTMGRNQTGLATDDCLLSEKSKSLQDSYRIGEKYAQEFDQCDREVSQTYGFPDSRASAVVEKPSQARKRSGNRSIVPDMLVEEAERCFEDYISNIEDTDFSSFDEERSDGSSTLGGMRKGRDFALGEAETCRNSSGSTSRPIEMDGVVLPWLQWETSNDDSPFGKTKIQTPATPKASQRDSEKDSSPPHDPSNYSMSSHGSWSPGLFHSSPADKRDKVLPKKTGTSSFDMDEYLKVENNEEILFEMYRERNRIGLGGLLLCTEGLY